MLNRPLRIGTRGSPMALAQTGMVRDRIVAANPGLETELVVVTTVADKILDRPLSEIALPAGHGKVDIGEKLRIEQRAV